VPHLRAGSKSSSSWWELFLNSKNFLNLPCKKDDSHEECLAHLRELAERNSNHAAGNRLMPLFSVHAHSANISPDITDSVSEYKSFKARTFDSKPLLSMSPHDLMLEAQTKSLNTFQTASADDFPRLFGIYFHKIMEMKENGNTIRTRLNLSTEGNGSQLRIMLSNGRNAEIKIMPETASERALQRLRLKNCNESQNCTIELKEVGEGNKTRAAYEVKAEKTFKILGLFRNREKVLTQIDAETGEEIQTRRPWWSWLASEVDETEEPAE